MGDWNRVLRPIVACLMLAANAAADSKWNLSEPSSALIDSATVPFNELSGVTYVGQLATTGHHRFIAVQDEGGKLITLDVELDATGALVSAKSTAALTLASSMDSEGVAFTDSTRNSVFLSEENGPGVREFDLASGTQLQNLAIPSMFANRRSNFGFESLARSPDGSVMWTANEEALTVDGPVSTASAGTTVRLLRMNVSGNDVSAAEQFAYRTDPIHVAGIEPRRRSGLSDLVALPDGTVLALERSFDVGLTPLIYRSRVHEVDFSSATDVSVAPFATGLIGQSFTYVGKELLWSGSVGGANGQNLEGLCLGPRLANGNWLLVGVVDNSNGSDGVSFNTLVTFELSPNVTADFDNDGDVDGRDFLAWQRGFGTSIGATLGQGDGDRDGDVDADDLVLWSADYGTPGLTTVAIPEPASIVSILLGIMFPLCVRSANYIVSLA